MIIPAIFLVCGRCLPGQVAVYQYRVVSGYGVQVGKVFFVTGGKLAKLN